MTKKLKLSVRWAVMAFVPTTFVALTFANPHGGGGAVGQSIGLILALPYFQFYEWWQPVSKWVQGPLLFATQFIWVWILCLGVQIVISWFSRKTESNNSTEIDASESNSRG